MNILPYRAYGNSVPNSASSAIVMDVKTGRILYEKNIHVRRPMASTTKIMTALLALENSDIEESVKINRKAVGIEGSSIYLQFDEKVKMKDLLYGLMLRSGNDAAAAIAYHVAGSIENFADMMNKRAKELGAKNTNFVNPHGLHHDQHFTTAYDLALIARQALLNQNFKDIVKTKLWVSERDGYKYFYNKNKTLNDYEGGDGVKTGYTTVSGRCLVTSATRNGMQFVCVVLNDPNWFQDSYNLLDDAFSKYSPLEITLKDRIVEKVVVKDGKKPETGVISREDVIIPVTEEEKNKTAVIKNIPKIVNAPISRKLKVGDLKVFVDNKLIYTTDLYLREDIEKKQLIDKMKEFFKTE
ncbi:MAG: serine hydrolase [Bacillota bacterium]